jgi:hypothetical protein
MHARPLPAVPRPSAAEKAKFPAQTCCSGQCSRRSLVLVMLSGSWVVAPEVRRPSSQGGNDLGSMPDAGGRHYVRPAAGDCTRLAAAGDSSEGGEERWGGILPWGKGDVGDRRGSVLGIKKDQSVQ